MTIAPFLAPPLLALVTSLAGPPANVSTTRAPMAAKDTPERAALPSFVDLRVADSFAEQERFVRAWSSDGIRAGLARAAISDPERRADAMLVVEIGGKPYKYTVAVTVEGSDRPAAAPQTCACSPDELVAMVTDEVALAAPSLRARREATAVAAPAVTQPDTRTPVDRGPTPAKRRLGPVGIAGAALVAVGGLALVGGAVMVALPPSHAVRGTDIDERTRTSYRPGGIGALVGGAALLGTGIGLLVADRRRERQRATAVMTPSVTPRSLGIAIVGKF